MKNNEKERVKYVLKNEELDELRSNFICNNNLFHYFKYIFLNIERYIPLYILNYFLYVNNYNLIFNNFSENSEKSKLLS